MYDTNSTFFAPQLYIPNGVTDISFYEKAFGAVELRRFSNDDDSIHVSELSINGALFHVARGNCQPGAVQPGKIQWYHCADRFICSRCGCGG